jgi:dTDP-4-dehydrorhamnose reductase
MKLLVLVVGAGGQLGEAMADGLSARHEVITRTRADLDVTDAPAVQQQIAAICPDVIVNCTAYTNVDGAEDAPDVALAVNAWAPRAMARAATDIDATFVHFSTDFVFDGTTDRPYREEDAPNPRGTYAMSKLLGEWFAAAAPRHYVLRVESLFGGPRAKSSVDLIFDGIQAGRPVRAFSDRTVSPSFVEDVVLTTSSVIDQRPPYGLYHCVNSGHATWLDVAHEIARIAEQPGAAIEAVPMANAGLKAPRPKFAALANDKLRAAGITLPTWQNALERYSRMRAGAAAS